VQPVCIGGQGLGRATINANCSVDDPARNAHIVSECLLSLNCCSDGIAEGVERLDASGDRVRAYFW
jgi:hypothetical protein